MNNPKLLVKATGTRLYISIENIPEPSGLAVDLSVPLAPLIDTPDEAGLERLLDSFSKSLRIAIHDSAVGDSQYAIPLTDHILYECSVLIRNMVYPLQLPEVAV